MIIFLTLYSLFLHVSDAVLADFPPPLRPRSDNLFHPREIDPNKLTQRSEWNIVWSCFATIFACSWVAIHPNVPGPSDSSMRIFVRRLALMGCMLIVPELVIVWAVREWFAAHEIAEKHEDRGWTITHGFFISMGGFMLYENDVITRVAKREDLERLGTGHWANGSEKDIQDKSKGDSFSKGFAILQTTWFVSQCIARGVAGLVITELELATLAFALLNGILSFFWWNKPQNVSYPIAIYLRHPTFSGSITSALPSEEQRNDADDRLSLATRERSLEQHSSTSFRHSSAFGRFCTYFCELLEFPILAMRYVLSTTLFHREIDHWPTFPTVSDFRQNQGVLSVPTFYAPDTRSENRARLIGLGIGVLFGGIHCMAWSFKFLSVAEQFIWRISALNVTVIPIIIGTLTSLSLLALEVRSF